MRIVVKKRGNGVCVHIPVAILQAVNLHLDEAVDVREESGRIVIKPLRRSKYDLAELLGGITNENLHDEIDYGKEPGKELWR